MYYSTQCTPFYKYSYQRAQLILAFHPGCNMSQETRLNRQLQDPGSILVLGPNWPHDPVLPCPPHWSLIACHAWKARVMQHDWLCVKSGFKTLRCYSTFSRIVILHSMCLHLACLNHPPAHTHCAYWILSMCLASAISLHPYTILWLKQY